MIDLDDHIRGSGLTDRSGSAYQGIPVAISDDVMSHMYSNYSFRPMSSPKQEIVTFCTSKALSGLSKQGPMFRNSYVTGHLCHEIATWPRGPVFIDGPQSS
jgi:hypothetical protein